MAKQVSAGVMKKVVVRRKEGRNGEVRGMVIGGEHAVRVPNIF